MLLNKLNIGNKLALIMIGLSLVVIALLSSVFYVQFDTALKERVLLQLSSVKQLKIVKIRSELNDRLMAFEEILSNPELIQTDPSGFFVHMQLYDRWPQRILDHTIAPLENNNIEGVKLMDLTPGDIGKEITIGFVGMYNGQYLIAIAELPEVQQILLERTGMGQTGESYVVGEDFKMRTRSRFLREDPREIVVKTKGVKRAFQGESGEDIIPDYRDTVVFSSYENIQLNGLHWAVLSEINYKEALFPLEKLRTNLLYMLLVILVFILVVSYLLSRMIVSPVVSMEKKLISMSRGILDTISTNENRKDEIGRMFEALNKLVKALSETIVFAGKIGNGNFEAEFQPLSNEDKLGEALLQMKDKLREYKENEERLLKENQRSILNGEEKERSRLSKEMHDGLGPLLTTLRMNIQAADLTMATKESLLVRLDETIGEVRRISNNLMPSVLVDFGAGEAIGNLIDQVRENSPVNILYKNDMSSESDIDDSINIILYRIAQESLNNAIKHSNASEIKISVTAFDEHISYFISDNGVGFDQTNNTKGNGIRNMKERVKLANGTFDIRSNGEGTIIEIEIPTK